MSHNITHDMSHDSDTDQGAITPVAHSISFEGASTGPTTRAGSTKSSFSNEKESAIIEVVPERATLPAQLGSDLSRQIRRMYPVSRPLERKKLTGSRQICFIVSENIRSDIHHQSHRLSRLSHHNSR